MASPFRTPCQFNATAGGLGDFVVGTATAGHDTPQNLNAKDAKSYRYYAESADGLLWENGDGVWTAGTTTLARTTILGSSNTGDTKVDFPSPPIVSVFPATPGAIEAPAIIPSGTPMLFVQTAAPTGWTKQTTHNDKALRVVSGTAGSGGTNSFSSMFASRTSDGTTLGISNLAAHGHSELSMAYTTLISGSYADVGGGFPAAYEFYQYGTTTGSVGSGVAHTHTLDMRVQYVDVIIATKDTYAA